MNNAGLYGVLGSGVLLAIILITSAVRHLKWASIFAVGIVAAFFVEFMLGKMLDWAWWKIFGTRIIQ